MVHMVFSEIRGCAVYRLDVTYSMHYMRKNYVDYVSRLLQMFAYIFTEELIYFYYYPS